MVEVLFGDSEAGSMKYSKSGNAVVCLGFMLDVGDIKEPVDSPYRKDLIYQMYGKEQRDNELVRLKEYLQQGSAIRIWCSDAPYSRCGFYYLCKWLQSFDNEIWVVKLPEYIVEKNFTVSYHSWGEIAADQFESFYQYAKRLSTEEKLMYTHRWDDLVDDNSFLRVMLNGKVVGAPEEFYDFMIWKYLTHKPIVQARLIGEIMGNNQIGIGDWWYAKRIEYFIQQARIEVVTDSESKYSRTISLAKK